MEARPPRWMPPAPASDKAGLRKSFLIVIGLLISNAVAITLLVLTRKRWTGSHQFEVSITEYRTAVSIVVQIVSHSLGILVVHAFCKWRCVIRG